MEEKQWTIAHDIAFDLVDRGTDPNELGKVIAFVRQNKADSDIKNKLASLVQHLSNSRNALIRSRQTQRFYRNIQEAFKEHLNDIEDTTELLLVLGWSLRLMRYYRIEPKRAVEEQRPLQPQQRQPEQKTKIIPVPLPEEKPKPKFKTGDKLKAKVMKKQGIKVTVELQTDEKQEIAFEVGWFPKNIGDEVNLKVVSLDDNDNIKKVVPT